MTRSRLDSHTFNWIFIIARRRNIIHLEHIIASLAFASSDALASSHPCLICDHVPLSWFGLLQFPPSVLVNQADVYFMLERTPTSVNSLNIFNITLSEQKAEGNLSSLELFSFIRFSSVLNYVTSWITFIFPLS